MNKTEILIIGSDKQTRETIISLVNKNGNWNGTGVQSDEEAIEKFHSRHIDIIVFSKGIVKEEELKLRKIFTHQQKEIIILRQADNTPEFLIDDIKQAIGKKLQEKKYSFAVKDDVFSNN